MKRKLHPLIPVLFLVFSLLLIFQFFREEQTSIDRVTLSWSAGAEQQQTSLYESEGIYYGFLPSYADVGSLRVHADTGCTIWLNDRLWQNTCPELGVQYTLTIKNSQNRAICEAPLILMQSENIPALSIQLHNGTMANIENREEKSGTMALIDSSRAVLYQGDFESFHIRGNHTATLPKKPFALKFDREVDLLDSGGYTTYCLVANADDESRLRNKLVYETARELGLDHSPASRFVDLYVNGSYYGLYLLTDKIDVHPNRIDVSLLQEKTQAVNFYNLKHYDPWTSYDSGNLRRGLEIPTDPADITGGYLLELEVGYRIDDNTNTFVSDSGQIISIKYPAQCSAAQVNYIADLYQKMEDSFSDGTYLQYIDLESWAKYYLIEEFFGQIDKTSIFFYKDSDSVDPKLYAGPVWDFDWSFGLSETYSDELHISPYSFVFRSRGPFQFLWNQEAFQAAIRQIYAQELYPLVTGFLPEAFDFYEQQIAASHAMDKCRWDNVFTAPHGPYADSLSGSLDVMKDWIRRRTDCFQEILLENRAFIKIRLWADNDGENRTTLTLAPNSYYSPTLNIPIREGYAFSGWYDSDGVPLTADRLLTGDTDFYARWEPAPNVVEPDNAGTGSGFDTTFLEELGVLAALAGIGCWVFFRLWRDLFPHRNKEKSRSFHDDRTKIAP